MIITIMRAIFLILFLILNFSLSAQRTSFVLDASAHLNSGDTFGDDSVSVAVLPNEWYELSMTFFSRYSFKLGISQEIHKSFFLLSGADIIFGVYETDFNSSSLNPSNSLDFYILKTKSYYLNIPFEIHYKLGSDLGSDQTNAVARGFYAGYNYSFLIGSGNKFIPDSDNFSTTDDLLIEEQVVAGMKPIDKMDYFTFGMSIYAWDMGLLFGFTTPFDVTSNYSANGKLGSMSFFSAGLRLFLKHNRHQRNPYRLDPENKKLIKYY